jgi:hypothetical protein
MSVKLTFIVVSCLAMMQTSPCLCSQDSSSVEWSIGHDFVADAVIVVQDAGSFATSPLRFSPTDCAYAAGLGGALALLMTQDQGIKNRVGRRTTATLNDDFWDFPTRYGSVKYANIFALTMYGVGLFSRMDDVRITGRLLFESLTLSGGSVMVFRFIAGRSRPYGSNKPSQFNWFEWSNETQSFPSGHTVVAFALSTVLAERIDNIWARIGLYGLASLTAFARVYNNQHWTSDVVAGAALGMAGGFHVVHRENARATGSLTSSRFMLVPSVAGLRIEYRL